jgi:hypothetical protein
MEVMRRFRHLFVALRKLLNVVVEILFLGFGGEIFKIHCVFCIEERGVVHLLGIVLEEWSLLQRIFSESTEVVTVRIEKIEVEAIRNLHIGPVHETLPRFIYKASQSLLYK